MVATLDEMRGHLKEALANPKPVEYPIVSFDTVKDKWNNVLGVAYDRFKRI